MWRLAIDWRPAQIGLSFQPPELEIKYALQNVRLEQTPGQLEIEIEQPRVELDLRDPMAEIGLKPWLLISRELAAKGMLAAQKGIGEYAREGDELADVHLGADVAALTAQKAWPQDGREINVDVVPKSRVRVSAHGGVEIDYHPGSLSVSFSARPVEVSYRRGVVKSYLAARAFIHIDVVGNRYSAIG